MRIAGSFFGTDKYDRVNRFIAFAGGIAAGAMLVPVNGTANGSEITTTEPSLAESYLVAMQGADTDAWLEDEQ